MEGEIATAVAVGLAIVVVVVLAVAGYRLISKDHREVAELTLPHFSLGAWRCDRQV